MLQAQTIFEFALDSIILQRNKNRQVQIFMIKANREVAADRKLFQILYNNHHTHGLNLGIKCEPDYQTPLQNFMTDLVHLFLRVQNILINKISNLEERLQEVVSYCARLQAILLSKNRSNKLYSFANSPLSKPNSDIHQSAYKHTSFSNTGKLNISKYSPQIETQPQTTQKQPTTQQLGNLYFDQKLSQLHGQISQLRQHINFAHPSAPPSQPSIKGLSIEKGASPPFLSNSFQSIFQSPVQQSHYFQPANKQGYGSAPVARRLSSMRQYWEEAEGTEDEVLMRSQLQKFRAVIKQYQKQQAIWRLKLEKYKVVLLDVLGWLKNLKDVQLASYMPCQACQLKQIIDEYLKTTPISHQHNHSLEQKSDDKESLLMDNDENDIFHPQYQHRNKLSNQKSEQQRRQNIQYDEIYGSARNRKMGSAWTIQQDKFSIQSDPKDNQYIYVEDGDDDVDEHFDDVRQTYGNNCQSDSD